MTGAAGNHRAGTSQAADGRARLAAGVVAAVVPVEVLPSAVVVRMHLRRERRRSSWAACLKEKKHACVSACSAETQEVRSWFEKAGWGSHEFVDDGVLKLSGGLHVVVANHDLRRRTEVQNALGSAELNTGREGSVTAPRQEV